MTKGTKIVLGVVAVASIPVIIVAIIFGKVAYTVLTDKEGARLYSEAVKQGPEFGKTTDQNGCMTEGFAQLKGIADPTMSQLSANQMFVKGCFETARQTPDFCRAVPSVPYLDWVETECKRISVPGVACRNVMNAKHKFCNGL